MSGNPILDEIDQLSPGAKAALASVHQQSMAQQLSAPGNPAIAAAKAAPPMSESLGLPEPGLNPLAKPMGQGLPSFPSPTQGTPSVKLAPQPRGTVTGDQQALQDSLAKPAGLESVYGRISNSGFAKAHPFAGKLLAGLAQVPATVADAGLSLAPFGAGMFIPGTSMNKRAETNQLNRQLENDVANEEKQAQTANLESQPELRQAKADLEGEKLNETKREHDQQLREHGYKIDETGKVVPLSYDEMSESQQSVHDLKTAQEEEALATADLRKAQADPNSPAYQLAAQRVENARQTRAVALQRLGLSEDAFNARYHGTDSQGNPLPGAMITDQGQPVGSSFSQNVRPTGTERNKADMAASAAEQLNDIAEIVSKHPKLFGPGYGQTSAFRQWIGSQDPDAQRFIAARTIAGDHLAGTFGGRSEAALSALDAAIGQYKDNPAALKAGLAQLSKANQRFLKAGTVRTEGSHANEPWKAPEDAPTAPKEDDKLLRDDKGAVVAKSHGGKWVQP